MLKGNCFLLEGAGFQNPSVSAGFAGPLVVKALICSCTFLLAEGAHLWLFLLQVCKREGEALA